MKSNNPCGLRSNFFILTLSTTLTTAVSVQAQSITAAPDGTGTIINHNGNTYHIEGGTQAGVNLFHSFEQFGLNPQEIANFLSNPNITNILGRVTGGDPSIIQGLIKLSGGNSNLFLMNPAGWVFTQGASLDVPGSFGVTTATRIGFGEGYFNAYGENLYSELLGNPTHLIFDQNNPSFIVNQGYLAVPEGESLWIVGGGVISTGTIEAPNGNITIAAVPGKNQIELSHEGMVLDLILKASPADGKVSLANGVTGIKPTDIPALITGGDVQEADTAIIGEDGSVRLVASDKAINQGDTVIAGNVIGENITLMAAGGVTPTDYDLMSSNPTVVLFPEAIGDPVEATFIDESVKDYQDFLYGGKQGAIAQIVTHQENGIETVTNSLAVISEQGGEVSAVHLLTEGNEGEFWLGNAYVNNDTITSYQEQLEQWGETLIPGADILLYACFTALGETGTQLINTLATATGADVAASTNLTGNAALGGDWELEVQTGRIETGLGFEQRVLEDFTGQLAVMSVGSAADLIQAIKDANSNGKEDTINLAADITLMSADAAFNADGNNGLGIQQDGLGFKVTLNGMGHKIERAAGAADFRLFHLAAGAELEINDITISGGVADGTGSARSGGGIFNLGTLTVQDSTLSGNSAASSGGGILNDIGGTVTVQNSALSGNTANWGGGGIFNKETLTVQNSTLSDNFANFGGGGIYNQDTLTVQNSTLSGNIANNRGGGILNKETLTVQNSTLSDNSANWRGGGIYNSGTTTLDNSIIAQNTAGNRPDLSGSFDSEYSLIGDTNGATLNTDNNNIKDEDPELLPLGDYGGPTQTHALKATSLALNAGSNVLATGLTTDQRGESRTVGSAVDMGAFELQYILEINSTFNNQSTTVNTPFGTALEVKTQDEFGNGVPGVNVNLTAPPNTGATTNFGNTTLTTDASGEASTTATANTIAGAYQIEASSAGLTTTNLNLTNNPDLAANVAIQGGNHQSTTVATDFNQDLQVKVTDQYGNAVPNADVAFTAPNTGASLDNTSHSVPTDANGWASFTATANTVAGEDYIVQAATNGVNADFNLTNHPDLAANVAIQGGNHQSTTVATDFNQDLQVKVTDQYGNAVPNADVAFTAPNTGASLDNTSHSVPTDANGWASFTATANTLAGEDYIVQAATNGVNADFNLTNYPDDPVKLVITEGNHQSTTVATDFNQALKVQLVDQYGNGISNTQVTVTAPNSGASITSPSQTLTSDAQGFITFSASANAVVGSYQITVKAENFDGVTFNLTNTRPSEDKTQTSTPTRNLIQTPSVSNPVENVNNSNAPDFAPIWQSIVDELQEDVLLGNACQTVPELELDDDGEEMEFEEKIEEKIYYNRYCRPVSPERVREEAF